MSELSVKLDRREFLKVLATAGASAAFISAVAPQALQAQGPVTTSGPVPEFVASLTGSAYNRAVVLATAGPGRNLNWQPGDSTKFLPPMKIDDGKYGDTFAALPKDKLLTTYQRMVTSRKWETTMKDVWLTGKDNLYGAFHPYIGEEAIANGVMTALNDNDFITSTHRGHGHLIAKGADINKMSAEIFARQTGYNQGFGLSMHITDRQRGILGMNGIVGGGWLLGAGAAYGSKILGTKQVAVTFAGDGGANSRYFMNAIRNSVAYNFPFIGVIENNLQNVATPFAKISGVFYQAELTKGLGIPSTTVDGNDIAAVYSIVKDAVDRARSGGGPSVIEAVTYRWYDHAGFAGAKVGVDGAFGLPYRSDDEVKQWMSRDPIARYKNFLLDRKLATADELSKIDSDVQAAVNASVDFARKSPLTDPKAGLNNVWSLGPVEATQWLDRKGVTTSWVVPEYHRDTAKFAKLYLEA